MSKQNTVTLWTFQPFDIYRQLQEEGRYICDPTKSNFQINDKWHQAYTWLIEQMIFKIGPSPSDIKCPIWAWHTLNWEHRKPDLRKERFNYGKKGEIYALIEAEIPENDVLLSDFHQWHFVLNDSLLDDSQNYEEWMSIHTQFDLLPPNEQSEIKRQSWNLIFDTTPIDTPWRLNGRDIQATFWELKKDQIKSIKHFKCGYRS